MMTTLCVVGGLSSVLAFAIGFVPPSQFSSTGASYFIIVGAGVGIIGFLAPLALLWLRKPSWKTAEPAPEEGA
jgi:hypothetical protein